MIRPFRWEPKEIEEAYLINAERGRTIMSGKALTEGEYHDLLVGLLEGVPKRRELDPDRVRTLLANKRVLHHELTGLLRQQRNEGNNYPIIVDQYLTIKGLIAVGGYVSVDQDITSRNFPDEVTGTAQLDAQLEHFGKPMSYELALSGLGQKGLRPGTVKELLTFGARYPRIQSHFPVIELRSVWRDPYGCDRVVILNQDKWGCSLKLYYLSLGFSNRCRFLAFPKEPSLTIQ